MRQVRQVLQLQEQGTDCSLQLPWLGMDFPPAQGPLHLERDMDYWTHEELLERMRLVWGKGYCAQMVLQVQMAPQGLGMGLWMVLGTLHRVQRLLELDTDCVMQVHWAGQDWGMDLQLLHGQETRLLEQDTDWMLLVVRHQEASQHHLRGTQDTGWLQVGRSLHHLVWAM